MKILSYSFKTVPGENCKDLNNAFCEYGSIYDDKKFQLDKEKLQNHVYAAFKDRLSSDEFDFTEFCLRFGGCKQG